MVTITVIILLKPNYYKNRFEIDYQYWRNSVQPGTFWYRTTNIGDIWLYIENINDHNVVKFIMLNLQ